MHSNIHKGISSGPTREVFLRTRDGKYQVGSVGSGDTQLAEFVMPIGGRGSWDHVLGMYDGQAWHLYIDGELVASTDAGVGAVAVDSGWTIGSIGRLRVVVVYSFSGWDFRCCDL